jgi:hypothetical protein
VRTSSHPGGQPSTPIDSSDSEGVGAGSLSSLADEVIFRPTLESQRLAKARFWAHASDNPMLEPESMSLDTIRGICQSEAIGKWWRMPGFKAWFLNKEEHRFRLEYLFGLALDAAEQILVNQDPKAQSARVNVIKVLSELAGKFPAKQQPANQGGGLAGAIGQMDRVQLEAYLQKSGVTMQLSASRDRSDHPATPETITILPETIEEKP